MTLFPRYIGKKCADHVRRKMRAHIILDRVRAGHDIPRYVIRQALRITGDLSD